MRLIVKIKFPAQSRFENYIVNGDAKAGDIVNHLIKAFQLPQFDQKTDKPFQYWFEFQRKQLDGDKSLTDSDIDNGSALSLCRGISKPVQITPELKKFEGPFVKR